MAFDVPSAGYFVTTHWSHVLAAGSPAAPGQREALSALCSAYWRPLHAFIRGQGHPEDEAQDLTQEFFARVLASDLLASAQPERGRFRTYLLACLRNFLANEHDRAHALKRGGGRTILPLDHPQVEPAGPIDPMSPERQYERRWALALLDLVLVRLRDEYQGGGRSAVFEALKGTLVGDAATSQAEAGAALGMTAGAVAVAVHRLRKRYRALLREEIGRTVSSPTEIDAEIRDLFTALG